MNDTNNKPQTVQPASRTRSFLLASVAAIALIAAATGTGLHSLAPWTSSAHAATAASPVTVGGAPGFADLIAQVEPAVVSVYVEMRPQAVSLGGRGGQQNGAPNGGSSTDPLFQLNPGPAPVPPPSGRVPVPMAEGAGFFTSADGYIVTANHVIDGAQSVKITTADGTSYPARIIGADPVSDVALLKIDANTTFTYVKFADQPPRVGDWVVAIGNPYGLATTATAGIVSANARDLGDRAYAGYLQIDAPINQGNSGGPTFDVHGAVVGINDAIFSPSGGSVGIGFDIPAATAKPVVDQLEATGHVQHAWLGVAIQDVTPDIAASIGLKDAAGAMVSDPQSGSPAAVAGIVAGDVITAFDGTPVKNARGLAEDVAAKSPGTAVKLDVFHSGESRTVTVSLGNLPPAQQTPPA